MNKMTNTKGMHVTLLSSFDSRFERLETAERLEKSLQGQIGTKLRKVFLPPSSESMPDSFKNLLEEIADKLE
jgi:hypothetical protein